METCAVIGHFEPRAGRGDQAGRGHTLQRCQAVLCPFRTGRTRTVRGVGAETVTVNPRPARCADCSATQIRLPTELVVPRTDSRLAAITAVRSTGVVYGTDVFCALVKLPALARVDDATLTAVMANLH